MADYQWIRRALYDRRISVVAARTGLSEPTIRAIRDRDDANPTLDTLCRLAVYFQDTAI